MKGEIIGPSIAEGQRIQDYDLRNGKIPSDFEKLLEGKHFDRSEKAGKTLAVTAASTGKKQGGKKIADVKAFDEEINQLEEEFKEASMDTRKKGGNQHTDEDLLCSTNKPTQEGKTEEDFDDLIRDFEGDGNN